MTLSPRLAEFERAAAAFHARAEGVPSEAWDHPRREGKWSPAQETEHIVLSHELLLGQLEGGPAMRIIATGWRQLALRWIVLPYILATGRFPRARAPRESRPSGATAGRDELLARLDRAAHGVVDAVRRNEPGARRVRLLHPYFGSMSIGQVVRLSAVHTRHHAANLPVSTWPDRSEAAPHA